MSKKSIIERNKKRVLVCKKFHEKRVSLMSIRNDTSLSMKSRFLAQKKLSDLPVNSSSVRLRNRCVLCGRSRAIYRKFGLCRIHLRELALDCKVPGLTKSSW